MIQFKASGYLHDGTEIRAFGETEQIAQKKLVLLAPGGIVYPPILIEEVDEDAPSVARSVREVDDVDS